MSSSAAPASAGEPRGPVLPAASSPAAVEVKGLCRRYGRAWALIDVGFRVEPGQALLVAGHNGSGKSTLLRVLAGALRPDRGTVKLAGHDSVTDRQGLRRASTLVGHAGFTYEALSAIQNLSAIAGLLGKPNGRDHLLPILAEVGLEPRADDAVHTFSAGMRRRLTLARVLLEEPQVVLLDEPYTQLDPAGLRLVDELFGRLRSRGIAVVVASHLLERSAAVCDRGLVLGRGRVVWEGPASQLPRSATVEAGAA